MDDPGCLGTEYREPKHEPEQRHVANAANVLQTHTQVENQRRVAQRLAVVDEAARETANHGHAGSEHEGHEEAHPLLGAKGAGQLQAAIQAEKEMDGAGQDAGDVDVEKQVKPFRGIEERGFDVGQKRPPQPVVRVPERQATLGHRFLDVGFVEAVHADPIRGAEDARLGQAHEHRQRKRAQHQHRPFP